MLEIPHEFQRILRPHLPYADAGDFSARDELAGLGLDSMGVVQLLVDIENGYAVALPDDILDEDTFATVGSLWQALEVHIA
ncbi:phosphopantetheine-binding protein [Nonomuraea typhae]|uniref:phosphopantetheine-binding protein n=1 Tax=Nonomuraea typhae TaxID=2603600 RepID=UPI0012F80E9E|nr:phosphopantetheine-binding protein [Nonomuraea typhae]